MILANHLIVQAGRNECMHDVEALLACGCCCYVLKSFSEQLAQEGICRFPTALRSTLTVLSIAALGVSHRVDLANGAFMLSTSAMCFFVD